MQFHYLFNYSYDMRAFIAFIHQTHWCHFFILREFISDSRMSSVCAAKISVISDRTTETRVASISIEFLFERENWQT